MCTRRKRDAEEEWASVPRRGQKEFDAKGREGTQSSEERRDRGREETRVETRSETRCGVRDAIRDARGRGAYSFLYVTYTI